MGNSAESDFKTGQSLSHVTRTSETGPILEVCSVLQQEYQRT